MNVKLISITKPMGDFEHLTPEELIVYCARVSNPQNQNNIDTSDKLLKYCINHKHWSIFEQVSMTVEIETSRAISAQILRHKSFNFQEFSQRYSELDTFEVYPARSQDLKNRQNSVDDLDEETKHWFKYTQKLNNETCLELYDQALAKGIAKEQARFLLPISATTKLYMTGSVRSYIHYILLRTHQDTQREHREIANEIANIFKEQLPIISKCLDF